MSETIKIVLTARAYGGGWTWREVENRRVVGRLDARIAPVGVGLGDLLLAEVDLLLDGARILSTSSASESKRADSNTSWVDYYELLQVSRSAGPEVIKAAYKQRSRQVHPDLGGDEADMRLLNDARDVLLDDTRRREFDRLLVTRTVNGSPPEGARTSTALDHLAGAIGPHSSIVHVWEGFDKYLLARQSGDGLQLSVVDPYRHHLANIDLSGAPVGPDAQIAGRLRTSLIVRDSGTGGLWAVSLRGFEYASGQKAWDRKTVSWRPLVDLPSGTIAVTGWKLTQPICLTADGEVWAHSGNMMNRLGTHIEEGLVDAGLILLGSPPGVVAGRIQLETTGLGDGGLVRILDGSGSIIHPQSRLTEEGPSSEILMAAVEWKRMLGPQFGSQSSLLKDAVLDGQRLFSLESSDGTVQLAREFEAQGTLLAVCDDGAWFRDVAGNTEFQTREGEGPFRLRRPGLRSNLRRLRHRIDDPVYVDH